MIVSRITSQGRITVPPEVRAALGLKEGDVLRYTIEGDRAILSRDGGEDDSGEHAVSDALLAPIIDAALADQRPTLSVDEVRAVLNVRIGRHRAQVNAA